MEKSLKIYTTPAYTILNVGCTALASLSLTPPRLRKMRYFPPLQLLSLALAGRGAFAFLAPGPFCVASGDRSLHAEHAGVFAPVVAARLRRPAVDAVAVGVASRQLSALR